MYRTVYGWIIIMIYHTDITKMKIAKYNVNTKIQKTWMWLPGGGRRNTGQVEKATTPTHGLMFAGKSQYLKNTTLNLNDTHGGSQIPSLQHNLQFHLYILSVVGQSTSSQLTLYRAGVLVIAGKGPLLDCWVFAGCQYKLLCSCSFASFIL